MTSLTLLAAALLSCQSEPNLTDKEKLQGTWKLISGERAGEPMPDADKFSLVIEGDVIQFKMDGGGYGGNMKLDHGRVPKVLDMVLTKEGDRSQEGPVAKGIYKIEDDTLTWCNAAPNVEERPTEFSTTKENNHMLVTFKRVPD